MHEDAPPLAIPTADADLEELLGLPVDLVELPTVTLAPTLRREGEDFEGEVRPRP